MQDRKKIVKEKLEKFRSWEQKLRQCMTVQMVMDLENLRKSLTMRN